MRHGYLDTSIFQCLRPFKLGELTGLIAGLIAGLITVHDLRLVGFGLNYYI